MKFCELWGAFGWAVALFLVGSCGDTTSDLITRPGDAARDCENDADCDASLPRCQDGHCVADEPAAACESSEQCDDATAYCDTGSGVCRGCLEAAHCDAGQICVLPIGSCADPCSIGDCPTTNPVCDLTTGLCTGCTSDAECPEALPVCDESNGRCVECASSEDCDGEEPFCDAGRCVECLEPGHCQEQGEGCSPMGQCAVPCEDSSSCSLFDDPICDASGYCVECLSAVDCEDDETCVRNECEDLEDDEEAEEEADTAEQAEEADDE